ncbi:MAG: hypothetical protein Kow0056_03700 [Coriobacteriia bacterium]
MARILCVDDDSANLAYLETLLESAGHEVITEPDGMAALARIRSEPVDLVVSDILMPHLDGYRLAMETRADQTLADIPFIFFSASYTDPEDAALAQRLGIRYFLRKPVEPDEILAKVDAALERSGPEGTAPLGLAAQRDALSQYSQRLLAKLEQKVEELQSIIDGAIRAMLRMVEIRDPYTAGHQERVATFATWIAMRMGLSEDRIGAVTTAGILHDVGKLSVPAEILAKPGRLSANEFALIQVHPAVGRDILTEVDFPWPVADIVLQHHERLDGSGYPQGLAGADIRVEARVLAVADVVEAMSSHRPYRPALGLELALEEIGRAAGALFDEEAVAACKDLSSEPGFSF